MEIKKLDCSELRYPIFGTNCGVASNYLEKVIIEILKNTSKKDKITLIARGTSGAICSGYVASGLINLGYDIKIVLSRKHVTKHDYTTQYTEGIVVFVDDVIESGETLASVIEEYHHVDYAFVSTGKIMFEDRVTKRNFEIINKSIDYLYLGS